MASPALESRTYGARVLDAIERLGNKLPNPLTLFVGMAVLVLVASAVTAKLGVSVPHPKDGAPITAVNLLNRAGIQRIFTEAVKNFMGFAPLGTVLAAMIGIGVAEATGLIAVTLRAFVMSVPKSLITATIVFAGINAHIAADAGLVVLPPIAALLFAAIGRHPVAGIAAAFAGVAGGFSATMVPTTLDVLLAGFTQEAVNGSRLLDKPYDVQVLGNYYFLFVSTPVLTIVGTWITTHVVEKRLGPWKSETTEELKRLEPIEKKGLIAALIAFLLTMGMFAVISLPSWGPLHATGSSLIEQLKPFFDSMIVFVLLMFLIPGMAFGLVVGRIKSDHDIAKMTGDSVATMGTYIVIAFAAAQFISYFSWSNLGAIVAIAGANTLRNIGFEGAPLLVAFVLFTAFADLFMASATAKWAMLAPVFVPMFLILGFTPEGTQAVFRIGDSTTNVITPLMPYAPLIIGYAQKYDPKLGMGTMISMMMPYSISFLCAWTGLLLVFYFFNLPIGPGVGIFFTG